VAEVVVVNTIQVIQVDLVVVETAQEKLVVVYPEPQVVQTPAVVEVVELIPVVVV
jgi:hypothetical protein